MNGSIPSTTAQHVPASIADRFERKSKEEIDSMNVHELRAYITKAGLSFADCVEKSDLRARAHEAAAKAVPEGCP